jgi:hypothetical protein
MANEVAIPPDIQKNAIAPPAGTLVQDYKSAGNANDLYSLLPRAEGTTLAPRILRSAEVMTRASAPVADVMAASNAKGGVETAEGRLAVADAAIRSFDKFQPETSFLKGLAAGMMGRKDWQNLASQGVIRPVQEFDKDGRGAVAFYAQNSDMPTQVIDKLTGKPLTDVEYESRGFGKYKNITDTPGYIDQKKRTEMYAENFVKEQGAANVGSSVFPIIAENSNKIYSGFDNLRKYGLDNTDINELQQMSTKTQSVSSAVSSALQEFRQANDSQSLKLAIDKLNKVSASAGLPSIVGIKGDNSLTDAEGNSYSKNDLMQRMADFNNRSAKETQWTQSREQIIKSKIYQKLEGLGAKSEFDNILNLQRSNELLKADYRQKYGEPPVFASSIPYELGQPMKVGMANAVIDKANAEISIAYQAFVDKETRNGVVPAPGVLASAFVRAGIPASISAKYASDLDKIQSMPDIEQKSRPAEEPKIAKTAGVQQRSILKPTDESRLDQPSKAGEKMTQRETGKVTDFVSDFKKRKSGEQK